MKKISIILVSCLIAVTSSHAELQALDNNALQAVEGQAGADLSLKLSLNQNILSDAALQAGTAPTFSCTNLEYCRLAISFNKRFVQKKTTADASGPADTDPIWSIAASDPTAANPGHKLWLVMKGLQGTVNIQKLGLDGTDLVYARKSDGSPMIKPAIQLGFDATQPIQIRNLGFSALSIEQDVVTSYYDASGNLVENTSTSPNDYGYLKTSTYSPVLKKVATVANGGTTANNYDAGRETGFMGVQMNGNLALQGQIKIFACSDHSRC
ncbi:hypothetical protein HWI77_13190 [Acinetobacter venetianus]|uniref:DUF6160 domain-containing protein n=1 Tax=Acinetobacter venetianus (strain ATCC 31012 / DSM 23050 / BCRC 14357 / CCUG 45561 / CIP 110063 / KCTC 2702 / LMG 19082 / RAG-1) TaxID=1191460 RepID=N8YHM4_ACIVR|nr:MULTISPECIES: DUF6160 family protein [Acinetobacter]ENV36317.1 hypothetical protein F959_02847 [Acinetobacter venetianus RAG-1 = CIP 110063]KXO84024.1 hypothetical protein AYK86_08225 [Acinetobacter venetianus]KXZ66085.1 hypothetical protein AVENLUH7437_01038 [Acinetobacter venetianus]KXZ74053.1 hypothetical protein AVENLUH8758_01233 [Acinetobacter venetianus]QNH50626.1 hypothetical protein HWI77_13190 [Acinetobacter venetianus]